MVVGRAELDLHLAGCRSLKDKRQIIRSLLDRLYQRFRLSTAEVGWQDQWQRAQIGLAVVSNDAAHARQVIERALGFIEADGRCEISGQKVEIE